MDKKFGFETLNDEIFQSQIKARFKGKIFIGNFKDKRLCEPIRTYRDFVEIETKQELEFSKDLKDLLAELSPKGVFVGVTQSDESIYSIWTELEEQVPFGKFWFQVKI